MRARKALVKEAAKPQCVGVFMQPGPTGPGAPSLCSPVGPRLCVPPLCVPMCVPCLLAHIGHLPSVYNGQQGRNRQREGSKKERTVFSLSDVSLHLLSKLFRIIF